MPDTVVYLKEDESIFFGKGDFNITDVLAGGGGGGGGGTGTDPILFSCTDPVTVASTGAATTLIGDGEGTLDIAASTWDAGQVITFKFSGHYTTMDSAAGNLDFVVDIGGSLTLTVTVPMPDAQPEMFWQLDAAFTRISEGASGTVVGHAKVKLYVQDGTTVERAAFTSSPTTVSSTAGQTPNVEVDWVTADADNSITQHIGLIEHLEIRS